MTDAPRTDVERVEALLETALGLAPEARAAFLREVAAEDAALSRELASLVAHAGPAERFFDIFTTVTRDATLEVAIPAFVPLPRSSPDDRFRLEDELGHGGMGVVYRAWDRRLQRFVALKFLPPRWSADPAAEARFLAEARAAAALDHPNVCTLLEIGETTEGRRFLAMPCYEGETLAERLARGPLPTRQAVDIALQVARGLVAAHRTGIVHHDVKPGNVMLTAEGTVKLLDFGIARVPDSAAPGGLRAGTEAYMAPEQRQGDSVDARADLWALGVVLHEMLTGERPGRDRSDDRRPDVSGRLGALLERLLARKPEDRVQSAAEVVAALERLAGGGARRPWIAAAAVLLVFAGGWGLMQRGPPEPMERIAVLPFESRVEAADLAYVAEGLHEALVEELSRVPFLTVVSVVDTSAALDGTVLEVADRLGVDGLVRGVVTGGEGGLELSVRLTPARGRSGAWRSSFRSAPDRALPLARLVARDVARAALGVDSLAGAPRVAESYEPPAGAHEHYLKGLQALQARSLGIIWDSPTARVMADSAIAHLERAVQVAPDWSAAWSRLALARHWRAASPEDFERAREAAEEALRLDPADTQALASRGLRAPVPRRRLGGSRSGLRTCHRPGRPPSLDVRAVPRLGRAQRGVARRDPARAGRRSTLAGAPPASGGRLRVRRPSHRGLRADRRALA
jgi:TolB-like protein